MAVPENKFWNVLEDKNINRFAFLTKIGIVPTNKTKLARDV